MGNTTIASLLVMAGTLGASTREDVEPKNGALAGDRPRVIVSTDVGGHDPDDFQSMVHLLLYADVLDIEGLVSSPPFGGRVRDILEVIDAYEQDYPNLLAASRDYPHPDALRRLSKQGATAPAPAEGFSKPTEGSRLIIERAKVQSDRPLWVLVWGSITDVAQAVHDGPQIKQSIRVYSIAAWNREQDPAARDYLYENHPDLWWIESDSTFRGMYLGGMRSGDLDNAAFVEKHIKDYGALGALYHRKLHYLKMGDTPSLLYLLRGDPDDPTGDSWGGAYKPTDLGPHYWTDDPDESLSEGHRAGAKTVSRWREAYLSDFAQRMRRTVPSND